MRDLLRAVLVDDVVVGHAQGVGERKLISCCPGQASPFEVSTLMPAPCIPFRIWRIRPSSYVAARMW